ncbi:MAG: NAD(P)/FAD-dependent oxidoreductase [Deltaproteobacteria bacterium]|uniref:NAD(P)/FAD-dependent oxidoreductase n=1 Tax=Candidatus Desulfacyla euxinica TaxID=2841693 RepID=A0A8J6N0U3_9DELT|nr:NAD(P)/FAD-dependent oxidoreductase [Candidatus Desulfacyla euxinica]
MSNYLIIGNGVAGTTAAENIRKIDKKGNITMVTGEDLPFYYRIRLNEYISGEIEENDLVAKKEKWYRDQNINLELVTRIVGAKDQEKALITENNRTLSYDRLLIATGSHSFIPPIKGSEKKGVFSLRTIKDARDISAYARNIENVVLIGGGLLGLEAGNALRKLGKRVTVVEFFPRLLPRQLDVDGAKRLQGIMEEMGFSFRLGAKTEAITGGDQAGGVLLEDGETLSSEMVIISAGVRPNMELAKDLGLDHDKGIKVDEHLQTNLADIYAAGDVAEFEGMPYGIWPAAMEQGKIAGNNMAGGDMVYEGTVMANTLKVVGVDLASAGNIDAENEFESQVFTDEKIYKKIVIENDQITGCIMLGDTKGFNKMTKAISERVDVSKIKNQILSAGFNFDG